MSSDQEIPESIRKFFERFERGDFTLHDFPMSELYGPSLQKFLELQLYVLKRYQSLLSDRLSKDPFSDIMSQMAKNMMSAYIDLAKFTREYRKKSLEIQHEALNSNINMLEKFLSTMNPKED